MESRHDAADGNQNAPFLYFQKALTNQITHFTCFLQVAKHEGAEGVQKPLPSPAGSMGIWVSGVEGWRGNVPPGSLAAPA